RTAAVKLVYSAPGSPSRKIALQAPVLGVPLENVTWRVVIPPGYQLDDYRGGLRLLEEHGGDVFGVEEYQSFVISKRSADTQQAKSFLQQASVLLQKGEQEKAAVVLSQVSNSGALDAASNEDARV